MAEEREKFVLYERKEDVGIITLNRPKSLNAVIDPLLMDLKDAADAAKADREARVFIIRGEGRAFCAGADTKEAVKSYANLEEYRDHFDWYIISYGAIRNLPRPTIAEIKGYAVGAGLELSLACDLRVATEDAKMGFAETRVGATSDAEGTYILPRIVGIAKAKELFFTADFVDGKEAERIGLVNKAVPAEDLEKTTWELAKKIASNYPLEIRIERDAINNGIDSSLAWAEQNSVRDAIESWEHGSRAKGMAEAQETAHKRLEETKK